MKTPALLIVVAMMILPLSVMGVTPVHMGRISVDTTLYEAGIESYCRFIPSPFVSGVRDMNDYTKIQTYLIPFLKKNSNKIDIYSLNGYIGSSVIPIIKEEKVFQILLSCKIIDDDDGWESIVWYSKNEIEIYFKVFDDAGDELLADSGRALYAADLNNTFVVTWRPGSFPYYDSWRFRTNLSSESPKSLAKTKSIQSSPMQIYGLSGGDYRVTLSPSSGNQINFQMFDLLGRCVFDKQIQNLTSPVSFTVPEENVPNSPFIAKVNDGNGSVVKKQIPVK
jgi:hypothetical protein